MKPAAGDLGSQLRDTAARHVRHRRRRLEKWSRRTRRDSRKRLRRAYRDLWALYDRRNRKTYTTTLAHVPSRDEFPEILNRRGLLGDAVEIGVKTGLYSGFLLERWQGRRLISVDPWLEAPDEEYVDHANVAQDEQEEFYNRTRARLARFGSRSEIWRLTSVEAAERIEDASLDFAYIDARHDYESVLEDLATWYPKMRSGGILAGHDYVDGDFPSGEFGVKSAVDEFFGERGLTVHSTDGREPMEMFASWLVEIS